MTNSDRIIAALGGHPGLDDDELSLRTSIRPRQQVNQICRRLEMEGVLKRVPGPNGKIVNVLRARGIEPSHPVPRVPVAPPRLPSNLAAMNDACRIMDPARTLFILPCSGLKTSGGTAMRGRSILDDIPAHLASALQHARAHLRPRIALDESALRPAWRRYGGSLYKAAAPAIEQALQSRRHILIVSGGYGIVRAGDAIGTYEAVFHPSDWPHGLLEEILAAYAARHRLTAVRAMASATTGYARLLRNPVTWRRAGIADAWLLSPERSTGAMVKAPAAEGEALAALLNGRLTPDWRSAHGLRLEPSPLL